MPLPSFKKIVSAGISVCALLSSPAYADAVLGPNLIEALQDQTLLDGLQVIVTFEGDSALDETQLGILSDLGLSGLTLQSLPMAGVIATPAQIDLLEDQPGVRSIYLNSQLEYTNGDARALTGVDRMTTDTNMRTNIGTPYSGKGIGVVINDSGVDGTHPDLKFGANLVQNVAGQTNLNSLSSLLPVSYTEGVIDTDIGSGHGTHVAGTVGGTGAGSGGEHAGVAPGADLIGYGSGAVVFVLDGLGGFDYALTNQYRYNIRVINNSFGQSGSDDPFDPEAPFAIASKILADRGIITVFAAGNDGSGEGTIGGSYIKSPWVVSVGAGRKDGLLADFSSRGVKGAGGTATVDGQTYEWKDQPTIVAPGVGIISALANAGALGYLDLVDTDYASMQGTSMAAPHTAGVIALMMEANPLLTWVEVKDILAKTATNMPGREDWEVGAGYINAYAAVMMAAELRTDFGSTVSSTSTYNASVASSRVDGQTAEVFFNPITGSDPYTFEVSSAMETVSASATVSDNTVAIRLIDPMGNSYGSSISTPLLGENIAVTAPAIPGTWSMEIRGIGSISGVPVDPLGLTEGVASAGFVDVDISFTQVSGFNGIDDVPGHPAEGIIKLAISEHLMDSRDSGLFAPDDKLTRAELAQYMMMGGGIRQFRASDGSKTVRGSMDTVTAAAAEATTAKGAALRDMEQTQDSVIKPFGNKFRPGKKVPRAEIAYSLVQALGLEDEAETASATLASQPITVLYDGERIPLVDDAEVPADLRGHVQLALDLNLINVSYGLEQDPFSFQPTITAEFDPDKLITRAEYALYAVNFYNAYKQAGE